jgi:hypothetical protein
MAIKAFSLFPQSARTPWDVCNWRRSPEGLDKHEVPKVQKGFLGFGVASLSIFNLQSSIFNPLPFALFLHSE